MLREKVEEAIKEDFKIEIFTKHKDESVHIEGNQIALMYGICKIIFQISEGIPSNESKVAFLMTISDYCKRITKNPEFFSGGTSDGR